jgi:hypothetical protein
MQYPPGPTSRTKHVGSFGFGSHSPRANPNALPAVAGATGRPKGRRGDIEPSMSDRRFLQPSAFFVSNGIANGEAEHVDPQLTQNYSILTTGGPQVDPG